MVFFEEAKEATTEARPSQGSVKRHQGIPEEVKGAKTANETNEENEESCQENVFLFQLAKRRKLYSSSRLARTKIQMAMEVRGGLEWLTP